MVTSEEIRAVKAIGDEVFETALAEEKFCKQFYERDRHERPQNRDRGVLDLPEIAFVDQLVHRLVGASVGHVGRVIDWEVESQVSRASGRTDLVLRLDGFPRKFAFEFKIGGSDRAYLKDLDKLGQLDSKTYVRVFCALLDVVRGHPEGDGRLSAFEQRQDLIAVGHRGGGFPQFDARFRRMRAKEISCVVGIWVLRD